MKRPIKYCLLVLILLTPLTTKANDDPFSLSDEAVIAIRQKLDRIEFEFCKGCFEHAEVVMDENSNTYNVKLPRHLQFYLQKTPPKKKGSWKNKIFRKFKPTKRNMALEEDGTPYKSTSLEVFSGVENNEGYIGNQLFFLCSLFNCPDFSQIPLKRSSMIFNRFLWALEDLGMNDLLQDCVNDVVFNYPELESSNYWAGKLAALNQQAPVEEDPLEVAA